MKNSLEVWTSVFLVMVLTMAGVGQQIDYNQQVKNKPLIVANAPLVGGGTLNPSAAIGLTQCPAFQSYRTNPGGLAWECSLVDWVQQLSNKPVRDVRNYGNSLTGTGKQAYSGSLTPGSTTFTLSNTQFDTFSPGDVGKNILISGVCGANVCDTWSSIVGYVSPTQITLSSPAANTVTPVNEAYWWNPQQDDTTFIQAAINDTTVTAPIVYLPRGVYVIDNANSPLTYSPTMRAMMGDGRQSTVIIPPNNQFQNQTLAFKDVNHFLLKGITFRGPGINGTSGGNVNFRLVNNSNTENLRIEDVEVRHACADAIFVDSCLLCSFRNVKTALNAAPGVHLKNTVSASLQQVYSNNNVLSGIWIDGGTNVDISGSASDANGISYYVNNASNVSLRAADAEAQIHRAPSAPASFPSVSVSAGGSLPVGTYFLKYTWVRQWSGNSVALESTGSPESPQVTLTSGNQTINFTLPAAPTDVPLVNLANLYLTATNGASGSEGFEKAVSVSGSPTPVSLSSFTTPGAAPPTVSQIGHAFVVDGGGHIHIDSDNSNSVPTSDARHLLILDRADDVQVDNLRVIEGSTTPAFDAQISSGVTNTRLAGNFSGISLNDAGTNTALLDRGTFKAPIFNALSGYQQNSAAPSGHMLIGNGSNYVDSVLSASQITAAGSAGQIQFNGNTAMSADTKLIWDNTNKFLGVGQTSPAFALDTSGIVNATAGFKSGTSTFSGLAACGGSTEGRIAAVTDSTTNAWGAAITGGGANHVLAYCDGVNWTVAGR